MSTAGAWDPGDDLRRDPPVVDGHSNRYYGPKGLEKVSGRYYTPENEQAVWDCTLKVLAPYLP